MHLNPIQKFMPGAQRAWEDALVVTAVISDLHLGTRTKAICSPGRDVRARLIGELGSVDQVVLLGDSIELRDGPLSDALATRPLRSSRTWARPSPDGGSPSCPETTTISSLRAGSRAAEPARWGWRSCPRRSQGDPLDSLARRMSGTELVLAYPGVWLRPDVYATHGHYLDCHNDVRTFECLARALVERVTRSPEERLQRARRLRGRARAGLQGHLPSRPIAPRAPRRAGWARRPFAGGSA